MIFLTGSMEMKQVQCGENSVLVDRDIQHAAQQHPSLLPLGAEWVQGERGRRADTAEAKAEKTRRMYK